MLPIPSWLRAARLAGIDESGDHRRVFSDFARALAAVIARRAGGRRDR